MVNLFKKAQAASESPAYTDEHAKYDESSKKLLNTIRSLDRYSGGDPKHSHINETLRRIYDARKRRAGALGLNYDASLDEFDARAKGYLGGFPRTDVEQGTKLPAPTAPAAKPQVTRPSTQPRPTSDRVKELMATNANFKAQVERMRTRDLATQQRTPAGTSPDTSTAATPAMSQSPTLPPPAAPLSSAQTSTTATPASSHASQLNMQVTPPPVAATPHIPQPAQVPIASPAPVRPAPQTIAAPTQRPPAFSVPQPQAAQPRSLPPLLPRTTVQTVTPPRPNNIPIPSPTQLPQPTVAAPSQFLTTAPNLPRPTGATLPQPSPSVQRPINTTLPQPNVNMRQPATNVLGQSTANIMLPRKTPQFGSSSLGLTSRRPLV